MLASDAECWYLIVGENCVCDVIKNLLCYVDLTKYKSFGLNRRWRYVVQSCTDAASEWQQIWLHQTKYYLDNVLPDSGWLLQSMYATGNFRAIGANWLSYPCA